MKRDSGQRRRMTKAAGIGFRPRGSTVFFQLVGAVSLLTFGLTDSPQAATAASSPWAACTSGLNVTGSPVQPSPIGAVLYAVSAPSASDAWAAGQVDPTQRPSLPLLEHWNGSTWSEESINLPKITGLKLQMSQLNAVTAFSPTDAWAGGEMQETNGTYAPVLLHWNGSDWEMRDLPVTGDTQISAMAGTGGGDLWIAEQEGTDQLVHSNGTTLSFVSTPMARINSIDSFAPDALEVGGETSSNEAEISSYQDGQWSTVADPGYSEVTDVSGTGPDDVWAMGFVNEPFNENYELQHYNGTTWTSIAPSFEGGIVTSDGADRAEAVLTDQNGDPGTWYAVQVDDPAGATAPSLASSALMFDPSWGRNLSMQAITATPRGALFAVGSLLEPSTTAAIPQGIVYRDC